MIPRLCFLALTFLGVAGVTYALHQRVGAPPPPMWDPSLYPRLDQRMAFTRPSTPVMDLIRDFERTASIRVKVDADCDAILARASVTPRYRNARPIKVLDCVVADAAGTNPDLPMVLIEPNGLRISRLSTAIANAKARRYPLGDLRAAWMRTHPGASNEDFQTTLHTLTTMASGADFWDHVGQPAFVRDEMIIRQLEDNHRKIRHLLEKLQDSWSRPFEEIQFH